MINYLKDLFSESGNASISRVLTSFCYITANLIAIYSVITQKDSVNIVATLLSAGTILKIGNKAME